MTQSVHLEEIPYCADSCAVFERIRDLPHAALLDSSFPYAAAGRYDILTAQPCNTGVPQLPANASATRTHAFFSELHHFHREHYAAAQPSVPELPFCGGILGYMGYDLGQQLHAITAATSPSRVPCTQLCAYDWCIVQDHKLQRTTLVFQPQVDRAIRQDISARLRQGVQAPKADFRLSSAFRSNCSRDEYAHAFDCIQDYIKAGDCYQVNLTQCFTAAYEGDAWVAYRMLRQLAAAPFAAYLCLGEDTSLLCLSPERFLALHGRVVQTSPIKGTRPRHRDAQQDEAARQALANSKKDRAENVMIVDLLRNDLGRSCRPGSIHVDRLFEVQSYPTVHHLVSTISGELQHDRTAWELLRDSFPGGSITGAPKHRAMEIIAELETHERRIYCGSVLYVSADGRMDSNIAIRSLLCEAGNIRCWGGGGIVADSLCAEEYQESIDKVEKFLSALAAFGGS